MGMLIFFLVFSAPMLTWIWQSWTIIFSGQWLHLNTANQRHWIIDFFQTICMSLRILWVCDDSRVVLVTTEPRNLRQSHYKLGCILAFNLNTILTMGCQSIMIENKWIPLPNIDVVDTSFFIKPRHDT